MRMRLVTPAAVAALVMLVAGCTVGGTPGPSPTPRGGSPNATPLGGSPGPGATPAETGPISYATGPTDLVLQATSGGGLLPQSMRFAEMPNVSIYGDGRVVTLGRHDGWPDDPLLPELTETRVTADGMARILQAARDAGILGPDRRYELPDVYDLWTVWFTATTGGQPHRVSAYALGFEEEARLAPPGEMEARQKLDALYGQLVDLRTWLPASAVGPDSAYKPVETRVLVTPLLDWSTAVEGATAAPASPRADQEVRDWPLVDPPESFGAAIGTHGEAWYCAVLGPDQVTALGLGSATKDTRWRAGGNLYQVVARPLLPDESGCPTSV
jgi:hypothetical protein